MASRSVATAIALILLATVGATAWANPDAGGVAITRETGPAPRIALVPAPKLTAAERCASLQEQFTLAVLLHLNSKKLTTARKLAEDGAEDCAKKKYSLGTRRMVEALTALGVTPRL